MLPSPRRSVTRRLAARKVARQALGRARTATVVVALLASAARAGAQAAERPAGADAAPSRWFATFHMGAGYLTQQASTLPTDRGTKFVMGATGGYKLSPAWQVGLELGGYLLRPGSDAGGIAGTFQPDTVGAGIMQALAFTLWRPIDGFGGFVRAGAGWADLWNKRTPAHGGNGWAYSLGVGHDWAYDKFTLQALLSYDWGTFGDVRTATLTATDRRYSAVQLRFGFGTR